MAKAVWVLINRPWAGGGRGTSVNVFDSYDKAIIARKDAAENYCWWEDKTGDDPEEPDSDIWDFHRCEMTLEIRKEIIK